MKANIHEQYFCYLDGYNCTKAILIQLSTGICANSSLFVMIRVNINTL